MARIDRSRVRHWMVALALFAGASLRSEPASAECLSRNLPTAGNARLMAPAEEVPEYQAIGYNVETCTAAQLAKAPAFRDFICDAARAKPPLAIALARRLGVPAERACVSMTKALAKK